LKLEPLDSETSMLPLFYNAAFEIHLIFCMSNNNQMINQILLCFASISLNKTRFYFRFSNKIIKLIAWHFSLSVLELTNTLILLP